MSYHEIMIELKEKSNKFFYRYISWISSIPISQGITWEPTRKAVPNVKIPYAEVPKRYRKGPLKSRFLALVYELTAYGTMLQVDHSLQGFFSSAILWREGFHRLCWAGGRISNRSGFRDARKERSRVEY